VLAADAIATQPQLKDSVSVWLLGSKF